MFIKMYRHPAADLKHAIEAIMDITEKEPGINKAQKDQIIVRLLLFKRIHDEWGADQ